MPTEIKDDASDGEIKNTNQREDNTGMKKFADLELDARLMIWLTAGIFAMAAVTAFILIKQANVMQGQLDEMKSGGDQTDRVIVLNMGQLTTAAKTAVAAKRQADAAQGSVKAIQRQMRQDQRAWIKIEFGPLVSHDNPTKGTSIPTVAATITNTGKSPAKKIFVKMTMEKVPNGQSPSFTFPLPITVTIGSMWQGRLEPLRDVTILWINPQTKEVEPRPLTAAEDAELVHGKAYIATYATVTYEDVFGIHHQTTSCTFASESPTPVLLGGAEKCTDYGGVDNN